MKHCIGKEKLLLARNIASKEGSLAKAIYEEQIDMGWPGLASECEKICEEIGLKNTHGVVKDKDEIEDSVFYHNYKKMKEEMQRYSKLEEVRNEDFRDIQKYFEVKSLAKVRVAFRIRSKIIQTIKMNFKNMQI